MAGHLDGVKVLDLGIWRPVPYATQLLADMGAEVLKVEPPGGDPMRIFPDLFTLLNGWKHSVVIDLKTEAGRNRALELAAATDVVTEGFRPGVADRLGMGYEAVRAVNPGVIYCSISGYGQTGPLAPLVGHDLNYQAYAGALRPQGNEEPSLPTVHIADIGGGMAAAMAICAALAGRARTGEGERIDVSMSDLLASWVGPLDSITLADTGGPMGGSPTNGIFATADGRWVTLAIIAEDHFWQGLCDGLGGLDDVRGLTLAERTRDQAALRERLEKAIGQLTADQVMARLGVDGANVPVAPALSRAEMLAHPHYARHGAARHPVGYDRHPARPPGPAPELPPT
jgi:crotonobetainyl-CoA:carnitine CoA-transferase CaiB-like acyl-CoA transferase